MANSVETLPMAQTLPRPWRAPALLRRLLRFVRRKPLGAIGAVIVLTLLVMAIFAELIAPHSYEQSIQGARMKPPGSQFWMGTDNLSRDIWSRVVYGARISVTVGFATVALATIMATAIGISSAYLGGVYDMVVQRVVDAWMSFPALVVILSLMAALGPGLPNLILALSILGAASASRVIRGSTLSVMANPYVEAARALGAGHVAEQHLVDGAGPRLALIGRDDEHVIGDRLAALAADLPPHLLIGRVARVDRAGVTLTVRAMFSSPASGALTIQVLTSPAHLVSIDRQSAISVREIVLVDQSAAERAHGAVPQSQP